MDESERAEASANLTGRLEATFRLGLLVLGLLCMCFVLETAQKFDVMFAEMGLELPGLTLLIVESSVLMWPAAGLTCVVGVVGLCCIWLPRDRKSLRAEWLWSALAVCGVVALILAAIGYRALFLPLLK